MQDCRNNQRRGVRLLASFRSIIPESEYREVVEKAKKVKAVVHSGQRKDGEAFTCCIQFDAAKREPTVSHPSWYKEAQRAGMEAAPKQKLEEKAAQQQKASQEQGQSQKRSGGLKK